MAESPSQEWETYQSAVVRGLACPDLSRFLHRDSHIGETGAQPALRLQIY
jgi:hypothetical protein